MLGSRSNNKWQFPAAFVLLLVLLVATIIRGPQEVVVAKPVAPKIKRISVVVVKKPIKAGDRLDRANLVMEQRPVNTVPADVVTAFSALKGKVAAGPIPAGYPLAQALLVDPKPVEVASNEAEEPEVDPLDLLLEEIKRDTVAVPLLFSSTAPPRGTRVALALSGAKGDTVLVLDDAWVSEASGARATLRVEPTRALFLQSARKLGKFSFIEIPSEGSSPYSGHAVKDMEALELAMGLRAIGPKKRAVVSEPSKRDRRFRSYAWIRGTGQRYGIDEKGMMYLVDSAGKEIGPVVNDMD